MTENEMVGWHHRHNGHEFEQAGVLQSMGRKELDTTGQLNLFLTIVLSHLVVIMGLESRK